MLPPVCALAVPGSDRTAHTTAATGVVRMVVPPDRRWHRLSGQPRCQDDGAEQAGIRAIQPDAAPFRVSQRSLRRTPSYHAATAVLGPLRPGRSLPELRFVGAGPVDLRNRGSHRTQIRRDLAPVMDDVEKKAPGHRRGW